VQVRARAGRRRAREVQLAFTDRGGDRHPFGDARAERGLRRTAKVSLDHMRAWRKLRARALAQHADTIFVMCWGIHWKTSAPGAIDADQLAKNIAQLIEQGGKAMAAYFTLPRLPASVGKTPSTKALAEALGVKASEIGFGAHRPSAFSAGAPFVLAPLRDLAAMARATGIS